AFKLALIQPPAHDPESYLIPEQPVDRRSGDGTQLQKCFVFVVRYSRSVSNQQPEQDERARRQLRDEIERVLERHVIDPRELHAIRERLKCFLKRGGPVPLKWCCA